MKIHEYQAKDILKKYGIPIQDGLILDSEADIENTIKAVQEQFSTNQMVVKAQIHAGGRGKGGGVKFCSNPEKAVAAAKEILGMQLITHQTGPEGQKVRKLMIAEALDISKEYYVAITLNRETGRPTLMASSEGGMDIEEVAEKTPEKILRVDIDPAFGLQGFQAREICFGLGLDPAAMKQVIPMLQKLYTCYDEIDASIVEINPLVVTDQGNWVALDAKMNMDSNALYRHKDILEMRDLDEEDPTEVEAGKYHLNYIKLDGNVGCMVNGAGLAMGTMDIIQLKGGSPANFLDVGGGANVDTVKNGFRIILSDPAVKAVLINIFGGIVRCDRVANGIIQAVNELDLSVPVVVRLEGTNADIAKDLLNKSDLTIISADSLSDAAEKVVAAAEGK